MRILIVINDMHPGQGGPPRVVLGHAVSLAARGHDPVVIATCQPHAEPEIQEYWMRKVADAGRPQLPLRLFSRAGLRAAGFSPSLNEFLRKHVYDFDVVHVHGIWEHCLAYSGRMARRAGVPWMFTPHGMLDRWSRRRSYWKKQLASWVFRTMKTFSHSDGIHFLSEMEKAETSGLSLNGRPFVIGNGVFLENDRLSKEQSASRVPRHSLTVGNGPVVLFHSRIHPKKGILNLIDGFAGVLPEFPAARLLVAAIKQDASYESVVRERAVQEDVYGAVAIEASPSGMHAFDPFATVDVFALPSFEEGFSMAIIEAMMKGVPVLISTQCHMPIVGELNCGIIVEPNAACVEEGLRRLFSITPRERAEMGQRASKWVRDNCVWSAVAARLESAYCELIELRHSGAG